MGKESIPKNLHKTVSLENKYLHKSLFALVSKEFFSFLSPLQSSLAGRRVRGSLETKSESRYRQGSPRRKDISSAFKLSARASPLSSSLLLLGLKKEYLIKCFCRE